MHADEAQIETARAQPRLRARQVADRRRRRRAPGRCRQPRARHRRERARRDHRSSIRRRCSSRCPRTSLPRCTAALQRGEVPVEAWSRDGTAKLGEGTLVRHRQPDQPGDGDAAAQVQGPESRSARCGRTSSSRRGCSSRRAKGATGDPGVGGAARAAGHLRLSRRAADGKAAQRPVEVALTVGESALIAQGRSRPATSVVVEGQNQLRPGAARADARPVVAGSQRRTAPPAPHGGGKRP